MCLVVPVIDYYGEVWGPDLLFLCETLDRLCDNEVRVTESLASYADKVDGSAPKSWAGQFMHTVRSLSQGRDTQQVSLFAVSHNCLCETATTFHNVP